MATVTNDPNNIGTPIQSPANQTPFSAGSTPTTPGAVLTFAGSNYFKRFDYANDRVAGQNEITYPLYETVDSMSTPWYFVSGQSMTASFVPAYNNGTAGVKTAAAIKVFDMGYGCASGTANAIDEQVALYSGLKNLILDNPSGSGNYLLNGVSGESGSSRIAVISLPRTYFKQQLDPGDWYAYIKTGSSYCTISDSSATTASSTTRVGLRSAVVSGNNFPIGYVYHDLGLIICDADRVTASPFWTSAADFASGTPSTIVSKSLNQVNKIQGRALVKLNSVNFFCRAFNKEFNYSTNKTFADPSTGIIAVQDYKDNGSHTYVTSVGLYNDKNECLAVGKLSQPVHKSFDREFVVKVRLDY